jgi:uncharacterized integral membrane protein
MQIFYWLILLMAIGMAIFAVQNSNVPLITIKFLLWQFETSLVYTILGSMGMGVLIALFFCIPRMIRSSLRSKELKKQIKNLETAVHGPPPLDQGGEKAGGI